MSWQSLSPRRNGGTVPQSPISRAAASFESASRMHPGEHAPLTLVPYYRFLNKLAKRSVIKQLVDKQTPRSAVTPRGGAGGDVLPPPMMGLDGPSPTTPGGGLDALGPFHDPFTSNPNSAATPSNGAEGDVDRILDSLMSMDGESLPLGQIFDDAGSTGLTPRATDTDSAGLDGGVDARAVAEACATIAAQAAAPHPTQSPAAAAAAAKVNRPGGVGSVAAGGGGAAASGAPTPSVSMMMELGGGGSYGAMDDALGGDGVFTFLEDGGGEDEGDMLTEGLMVTFDQP